MTFSATVLLAILGQTGLSRKVTVLLLKEDHVHWKYSLWHSTVVLELAYSFVQRAWHARLANLMQQYFKMAGY